MMKSDDLRGEAERQVGGRQPRRAPRALTKMTPKCGIDISTIAATIATVIQMTAQLSKKNTEAARL